MNIIVDTHIYLWLLNEPSKIKERHIEFLEDITNNVYLSSISVAELMIKKSIGNIDINFDIIEMAKNMGLEILNFTGFDAIVLGKLPFFHKDPFDRMIISQAVSNNYYIISNDSKFNSYDCRLL